MVGWVRRTGLKGLLAAAGAAAALVAGARDARADIALALDADVAVPVDAQQMPAFLTTGASFDLRLGYRLRIPYSLISITPEVAGGYTDVASRIVRLRPGVPRTLRPGRSPRCFPSAPSKAGKITSRSSRPPSACGGPAAPSSSA